MRKERDDVHVLIGDVDAGELVAVRVRGDRKRDVARHGGRNLFFDLTLPEVEADAHPIRCGGAVRMVVKVRRDRLVLAQPASGSLWVDGRRRAHCPDREHVCRVRRLEQTGAACEQHRVMRNLPIRGPDLDGTDPPIRIHVHGDVGDGKEILAGRRYLHFRQLDDEIGLSELPAFCEHGHRRHVGGLALRRAGIGPCGNCADVRLAQARVVREAADRSIGRPRRHRAADHPLPDRPREGARFLEGAERHRRRFAGPMTAHALRMKNRRNVAREGGLRRGRRCDGEGQSQS